MIIPNHNLTVCSEAHDFEIPIIIHTSNFASLVRYAGVALLIMMSLFSPTYVTLTEHMNKMMIELTIQLLPWSVLFVITSVNKAVA